MNGSVPTLEQWRAMSDEEREIARLEAAAVSLESDLSAMHPALDLVPDHAYASMSRQARLIYQLSVESRLPLDDVELLVDALRRVIVKEMQRGASVTIPGIVTLDPHGDERSGAPNVIVADELRLRPTD